MGLCGGQIRDSIVMTEFPWTSDESEQSHGYLLPPIEAYLARRSGNMPSSLSVMDIGSGNGSMTAKIAAKGYKIVGVEPSSSGIQTARRSFPNVTFEEGSAYDDLAGRFGTFDIVLSCEVIEHLLHPQLFLSRVKDLLAPKGVAILTTPYHGYIKNVLISIAGKWDFHHHPDREWGHVKFFSRATLIKVAHAAGLQETEFHRVGRMPIIAKSMIIMLEARPQS